MEILGVLGWKFWGFWGGNFGGFEVEKTGVFKHHLTALKTNRHKGYKKRQKNRYIFIYIIYKKSQVLIFKSFYNACVESEKSILDLLVELKFVQSKGEAKRLIQGGGVKIDGEKISDMGLVIKPQMDVVLQAGKRKFAKLV